MNENPSFGIEPESKIKCDLKIDLDLGKANCSQLNENDADILGRIINNARIVGAGASSCPYFENGACQLKVNLEERKRTRRGYSSGE